MVTVKYILRKLPRVPLWLGRKLMLRVNRAWFAFKGIKYGKGLLVVGMPQLILEEDTKVTFGENCVITNGGVNPLCAGRKTVICCRKGARITIGDHSGFSSTVFNIRKSLTIGSHVLVGGNVVFMDSDAHSLDWRIRRDWRLDGKSHKDKEIVVGDDVLIGMDSTILKGVHIGSRSVIGAGSLVTKDIPDDCIAAGRPAKVIRYLVDEKAVGGGNERPLVIGLYPCRSLAKCA